MPCPKNGNAQRDRQQPAGSAPPARKRGRMPRPIVEFPEPLTADWTDPPTFPEAFRCTCHGMAIDNSRAIVDPDDILRKIPEVRRRTSDSWRNRQRQCSILRS